MDINIARFFKEANAFEFSHSRAEGGQNAGPDTWAAAVSEGTDSPLLTTPEQLDALRDYVRDFGAWDDDEIAAWSDAECNALFIQLISGDMREGGLDSDPEDEDWAEYERNVESGQCSGNIFRSGVDVYYLLDH